MKDAAVPARHPLQLMANGDVRVAQQSELSPRDDGYGKPVSHEQRRGCQSAEKHEELPLRVAFEQRGAVQGARSDEYDHEDQTRAQIGGLPVREHLYLVTETLCGLAHDAVRESRMAGQLARQHVPASRREQKDHRARDSDSGGCADCLYVHDPNPSLAGSSVSGTTWDLCDAGHNGSRRGRGRPQFSALVQAQPRICECDHSRPARRKLASGAR